jgi:RecB family endonuclease NucS
MRIIVANCSAVYTGRGDTKLNPAVRMILIKEDGAISLHCDAGNKPLNYMGKGNVFTESTSDEYLIWSFDTTKENLTLHLYEVYSDSEHLLDLDEEGLIRDGTESHLQEWLAANPEVMGEGYTLVQREFQTGSGPVDILLKDAYGGYIAVEVKRTAMLGSVSQVKRYVDALEEMPEFENSEVRGIVVALDIRPKTLILAEKRGIECVNVNDAWRAFKGKDPVE